MKSKKWRSKLVLKFTKPKKAIYTRISGKLGLDHDGQREKILACFGEEYEIVSEVSDIASVTQEIQDRPGLKKLFEDAVAKGEIDILLCSDPTRLRGLSPEIIGAIQRAGIKIVTVD